MKPARSLAVLFLAAISFGACKKKDDSAANGPPADSAKGSSTLALDVVGEPVRKGDLVLTVTATGQIRSDAVTNRKAEATGTVAEVLVRAGDRVKRGQALVRLDPRPLDLDVAAAEAQVSSARVKFNTDMNVDSIASGQAPPAARRAYALANSGLTGAEVALDKAKLARENAVITAPFDGVVDKINVAVGDRVGNGQDIATIVDLTNLRVEAAVLEHDLPLLRVGGDAYVTIAAAPDKPVRGTVAAILPLVDTVTRAGRAVVRIHGDGTLRPGMYADVRLESARLPNRIVVPTKAIIERENRPLVFVVKDGRAEWVYVNPGRRSVSETEILPDSATNEIPLKPGDIVLTDGHLTLSHQAPVRLTRKREADQPH
ncbi:MAG: efflux RND transporter periplasmic adaptor subunit [Gemmatimonadales bacterium]